MGQDEISVVQIEAEGYQKKQVVLPIVAMKGGRDVQKYVDLLVPTFPATLKLIQGEGPLHLVGCHCVDYYGGQVDDETEDEEMEAEEAEQDKPQDLVAVMLPTRRRKTRLKERLTRGPIGCFNKLWNKYFVTIKNEK